MKYKVEWLYDKVGQSNSAFTTWAGFVSDTTPGLRWALGKTYTNAENHIRQQGGLVILIENSSNMQALSGKPPVFSENTEVTITRGPTYDGD